MTFLGREREALPHYQSVLRAGHETLPKDDQPRLFVQLGSTLRNLRRFDESLEILQRGVSLFPDVPALKLFLSLTQYTSGNSRQALELAFQVILENPVDSSIRDYSRALRWYAENLSWEGSLSTNPENRPEIVPASESKLAVCEGILRSLPRWFGIEQAITNYLKAVERLPTFFAVLEGETVGFVSVECHNASTAEVHVMAVRESSHRRGVGRALVHATEEYARKMGCEFLMVKTLGPSRPNPEYDRTRNFYLALGFRPLEEFHSIWGDGNPCLLLVKKI